MYKFFAFLDRMRFIKRWSLMRSVREENIMEHSQQVAVITHALVLIGNKYYGKTYDVEKAVFYAQYHEVGEVVTGDLPTPIKYFNPEIKTAYKAIEKNACEKLLAFLPRELSEEYRKYVFPDEKSEEYKIVKVADRLAAYLKCVEEITAGNSEFKKAKKSILSDIKSRNIPEADFYLKEFAPAYELTLDELD